MGIQVTLESRIPGNAEENAFFGFLGKCAKSTHLFVGGLGIPSPQNGNRRRKRGPPGVRDLEVVGPVELVELAELFELVELVELVESVEIG